MQRATRAGSRRPTAEHDDEPEAPAEYRELLPRLHLAPPSPDVQPDRGSNAEQKSDDNDPKARLCHRRRQIEPPDVEKASAGNRKALPRRRQILQNGEIPEQELQQQRYVPDGFDVNRREPGNQPVGRQAGDAYNEADNGRKENADDRHQQRIEQTDPERAPVGRNVRVRNERLRNIEA